MSESGNSIFTHISSPTSSICNFQGGLMQPSPLVVSRPVGLCLALIAGLLLGAIALSPVGGSVAAQGSVPQAPQAALGPGFTYQGQLKKANAPVNDNSCSMTFSLWDSQSNGTGQVGASQVV